MILIRLLFFIILISLLKCLMYKQTRFNRFITMHKAVHEISTTNKHIVQLNDLENELFALFTQCVQKQNMNTTVRVAGGWVRDKLLGHPSKTDIDIALDNMSGKTFAEALNTWLKSNGSNVVKIGIVKQNPTKSKHLETATVRLLGKLDVDFVNLRKELYSENSRIPVMELGTPEQDAHRRDLTINSLFYNLHTKQVEDFTGQGINDLRNKVIRTPLPPLITLTDDPLRALRVVRFACRLNFRICEDLAAACSEDLVHRMLVSKVSAERAYSEVEAMLRHPSALRAIFLLHSFNLLPSIFRLPSSNSDDSPEHPSQPQPSPQSQQQNYREHFSETGMLTVLAVRLLQQAAVSRDVGAAAGHGDGAPHFGKLLHAVARDNPNSEKLMSLAALTVAAAAHKGARVKTEDLLMQALRTTRVDCKSVVAVQSAAAAFRPMLEKGINCTLNRDCSVAEETEQSAEHVNLLNSESGGARCGPWSRMELGLVVAQIGPLFPLAVHLAAAELLRDRLRVVADENRDLVAELGAACGLRSVLGASAAANSCEQPDYNMISLHSSSELNVVLGAVESLSTAMELLDVSACHLVAPLLPGNSVQRMFKNLPQEAALRKIMNNQQRWRLAYPNGTKSQLCEYLQQCHSTYL